MTLAHPWALLAGLAAIPVVLLYLRRMGVQRQAVATTMFWDRVLAEQPLRQLWRPWRERASLALHLLVVLLVTLALAEPQIPPPRRVVVIVDNSQRMTATDVQPTRLAAAKGVAGRLVAGLRTCDQMAVFSTNVPAVVSTWQSDPTLLRAAIERIEPVAGPTRMFEALRLARSIQDPAAPPGKIFVITDGCFGGAAKLAEEEGVAVVRVGTRADNRAITHWSWRRTPADPRVCQVLAEVRNYSDRPADGRLEIVASGSRAPLPIDSVPIRLEKDGRWLGLFEATPPPGADLWAKLDPADNYPPDNTAWFGSTYGSAPVTVVTGDERPLRAALEANTLVELRAAGAKPQAATGAPDANPPEGPSNGEFRCQSVLVFHGQVPEKLPEGRLLVLGAGPCDLWQCGPALDDPTVARVAEGLPILAGVRLTGAELPRARRLELAEAVRPAATPLMWSADGSPLAYAIERLSGRVVVISGDPSAGNLAQAPAFPILMANAVDWLAGRAGRGTVFTNGVSDSSAGAWWQSGAAHGVDLRVPEGLGVDAMSFRAGWPAPPVWLFLAGLALALLAAEWCLYQRRWMS